VARVSRGVYKCNLCGHEGKRKEFNMDHIEPVIPVEGFSNGKPWDWNEYIGRMYCEPSGYQMLCTVCHKAKTKKENAERKKYRDLKKEAKK
jgi:hypothetical protein